MLYDLSIDFIKFCDFKFTKSKLCVIMISIEGGFL